MKREHLRRVTRDLSLDKLANEGVRLTGDVNPFVFPLQFVYFKNLSEENIGEPRSMEFSGGLRAY